MRKTKFVYRFSIFASLITLVSCTGGGDVFTLYRASPLDPMMRIHVASFDSSDGTKYNSENCNVAAVLFQGQPGTTVKYWCEKGAYQK